MATTTKAAKPKAKAGRPRTSTTAKASPNGTVGTETMTRYAMKLGREVIFSGSFSANEVKWIRADWKETLGRITAARGKSGTPAARSSSK
jgi:hypothetical protein